MRKKIMKRVGVLFACVVVLCSALVLPTSAFAGTADGFNVLDGLLTREVGVGDELSTYPLLEGEDAVDIQDTETFIGLEITKDGFTAADENYHYGLINATRLGSAYEDVRADSLTVDGVFIFNSTLGEWVDCSDLPSYSTSTGPYDDGYTSANYPLVWLYRMSDDEMLGGATWTVKKYFESSLNANLRYTNSAFAYNALHSFAVRWTATYSDGTQRRMCYIGLGMADQTDGQVTPPSNAPLWYIGECHPEQMYCAGWDECETYYAPQIDDLMSQIKDARAEGYTSGYQAGSADAEGGLAIDTSDPANTFLGFLAVTFKGIRDFIMPFLDIEIMGISIAMAISGVGIIALVILAVFFIVKVIS